MPVEDPAQRLRLAAGALRAGDVQLARRALEAVLRNSPEHADAHHLMAAVHRSAGRRDLAEAALRRSLAARPEHPPVLNDLGNLLLGAGRHDEAEAAYRRAAAAAPTFPDPQRNLGLLLARTGRDDEAVGALENALRLRPRDPGALSTLGQCLRRLGRHEDSERVYRTALALAPGHANAWLGLSETLRHVHRLDEADAAAEGAARSAGETAPVLRARAAIQADRGHLEAAVATLRAAVAAAPSDVDAHRALNELLWQLGETAAWGRSWGEALARLAPGDPGDGAVLRAWCGDLAELARHDEILAVAQAHPEAFRDDPELLRLAARARAGRGERAGAHALFRHARSRAPEARELLLDHARLLIAEDAWTEAEAALDRLGRRRPFDQEVWALREVCWRLSGNPRARWLMDYDRFVRTFRIESPPGFDSLEAFLDALGARLTALHRTRVAPSNQTVRGGTQTFGRLFLHGDELIGALARAVGPCVDAYVRGLPEDPDHPLLGRRTGRWRFAGSWSVRLASGGYHVDHVHPAGWLSSAFYVRVPESLGSDPAHPAGWLRFGVSNLGLGDRERPARLVRPEPGCLTLFPSYCWHGTVPFEAPEPRLTAPFDVVPA